MASPWKISVLKWSDILAEYSLYMMITYLTNIWAMNFIHAAAIVNVFWGMVGIMPIAMRSIKDAKLNNLWMVLLSSFAYTTGLGFLAMSAPEIASKNSGNCSHNDKPNPNDECIFTANKALFFAALPAIVIGKSGYTASLEELVTEQTRGIISRVLLFVISTTTLVLVHVIGAIGIPYLIKRWSTRFGVPALCMAVGTALFLTGFFSFRRDAAKPGLLARVYNLFARCVPCLDRRQEDNADTASNRQSSGQQQPRSHRREFQELIKSHGETKFIMSVIPLCLLGVVSSIGNTYFIEQGNHMKTKIFGPFRVPLVILPGFYYLALFLFPRLYFHTVDYCLSSCIQCLRRWYHRVGIAIFLTFALLCCVAASRVETRRLDIAKKHDLIDQGHNGTPVPMTILHLVPQFLLLGGLDGMAYESIERFFADQEIPSSLKPYMVDSAIGVFGVGKIINVLLVYLIDKVTEKQGKNNSEGWFADTLNKSRLDNYYWFLAVLTAFNFLWYIFVAIQYPPKTNAQNRGLFCLNLPYFCTRRDTSCCLPC